MQALENDLYNSFGIKASQGIELEILAKQYVDIDRDIDETDEDFRFRLLAHFDT